MLLFALYLRRTIPVILEDVGQDIGEQFGAIFEKPTVKQAMSVMGKKSGEVRASAALRNKAAEKIIEGYPSIGFLLEQMDMTPVEGLQLWNDPLIGPMIRGALSKGVQNLGKNFDRNNPGEGVM